MTTTPTAPATPDPSDRQLVVYENNTANPNYGRLMGIPPGEAKGIGLPAYKLVTSLPVAGGVAGEAVFDTSTKAAFVWDGGAWQIMPPRAKIPQWSNAQSYAIHEVVEWQNALWVATQATPANVSPDGVVVNWRRITSTSVTPRFASYDPVYSYQINDHVYVGNALYEAAQPSTGSTPVWPTDTADWRYVGNINKFDPDLAKQDLTDGSVITFNGANAYELRKPAAGGGSAGYIESQLQAIADLTSRPTHRLSFIGYASLVSGSPGYVNPLLIAESNGAWIDMLDGGEMLYCQQNNHSAEIYGRTANKFSSEWGSSNAGMPILSPRPEFKPTVNDHIEFNLKFNRLDNDWWLLKATMASRVWGNQDGDSNTIFKIKASNMTGLTKLGMKYLGTSTSNVLMGAIEWN